MACSASSLRTQAKYRANKKRNRVKKNLTEKLKSATLNLIRGRKAIWTGYITVM